MFKRKQKDRKDNRSGRWVIKFCFGSVGGEYKKKKNKKKGGAVEV